MKTKNLIVAMIAILASVVFMSSCKNGKSKNSDEIATTSAVDGTEFVICQTEAGNYGVQKGETMVIQPTYRSMEYNHGMFVADKHMEFDGVVIDDKVLINPETGNECLTGDTFYFVNGNFESVDDGKKAVYLVKAGIAFAVLNDYALSEDDDMIVTDTNEGIGVWTTKRDTIVENSTDYEKMVILKGKKQLLTFSGGNWYIINTDKGNSTTAVNAATLKQFKKNEAWSDEKKVFAI